MSMEPHDFLLAVLKHPELADVTLRQLAVLTTLAQRGPQSQTSLIGLIDTPRPAMSRILQKLEFDRLVSRRRSGSPHSRSYVVTLTPAGEAMVQTLCAGSP